jgi:hypothetical protein
LLEGGLAGRDGLLDAMACWTLWLAGRYGLLDGMAAWTLQCCKACRCEKRCNHTILSNVNTHANRQCGDTPSQNKSSQSSQVSQTKPSKAKPSLAKPNKAKPSKAKPSKLIQKRKSSKPS